MILKICDILNTVFQSALFTWVCNNIAEKDNKISKFKSYILTLAIFIEISIFTTYSNINPPVANLIAIFIVLLLVILFYRKSILDSFIGFTLTYFIITVTTYFPVTFYQYYLSKLNFNISPEFNTFIFLYIPIFLLYPLFYVLRKYFFSAGMFFRNLKYSLIIVQAIAYALIFLNTLFMEWVTENMNPMVKAILYSIAFMAFVFIAIYFAKINDKSKEVEMLNIALNDKINELRKIKHDYGSEISGLYGLYQLGKFDRIGELLKSIVEKNEAVSCAVNVKIEASPITASVLNSAVLKDIDLLVFDYGNYDNLAITDNELLKVLSNIINNAIDVLEDVKNPLIKFKSLSNYNGIIIIIDNNGPEIPKEFIDKIFETGFSTKENNNNDRGYGLGIVSDIINNCNGKISVASNKNCTQFKIEIPYNVS